MSVGGIRNRLRGFNQGYQYVRTGSFTGSVELAVGKESKVVEFTINVGGWNAGDIKVVDPDGGQDYTDVDTAYTTEGADTWFKLADGKDHVLSASVSPPAGSVTSSQTPGTEAFIDWQGPA